MAKGKGKIFPKVLGLFGALLLACLFVGSGSYTDIGPDASSNQTSSPSHTTETNGQTCTVTFLDVGQGDSALIECGGHWLLIDGGPADASQKLYAVVKAKGIERFDAIIATHSDADHIGGISGALNATSTSVLYCSTDEGDTKTFKSMKKYLASSSDIDVTIPAVGDSFMLGSARITFVGPTARFDDDNNSSLVVRLDFGTTSFLFTADAESESEQSMLASGADVSADVLKVAHHGSASSSTLDFLRAVAPRWAVISVGENTYGHPKEQTLGRLESIGAQILRTDELGDIVFISDGTNLTLESNA